MVSPFLLKQVCLTLQTSPPVGLRLEKRKKYKSLWDDEEKKEREDPMEAADAEEAFAAGPEVVSVESVMEAATGEMESE